MKILLWPRHDKLLFGTAVLQILALSCNAMKYKDPLTSEDLANMFNDDGCIEGTFSMLDLGPAVLEPVTVIEAPTKESNDFGGKSPMSLLHELATHNNIQYQYDLTDEVGPAHKKKFVVALKLGEENYIAEGKSIKKAQHEAAKLAFNSTLYNHPPIKNPDYNKPAKIQETPVEKLNKWAKTHGKAQVKYSFNEKTMWRNDYNQYHKGMYSKAENVHTVSILVLNREFTGEGFSSDAAKQNAAKNALNKLQESEAFCLFDDGLKQLFNKIFTDSMDSPISLIHQFGSKSKMETYFDLVSEEGPSHIKKFVYKCKVGDQFETFGEGSSKKEARRDSAESMIRLLKLRIPFDNQCIGIEKNKPKKKKSKNLVKSAARTYNDKDDYLPKNSDFSLIEEEINPISKLYQLQQMKHGVEPTFQLVEERGYPNKEFFMEVRVGETSYIGSGPSKKIAKKKAAEGILTKLGYSSRSGTNRNSDTTSRKKEFQLHKINPNEKNILPGINLNSDKFAKFEEPVTKSIESATPDSSGDDEVKTQSHHGDLKLRENKKSEGVQKDSKAMKPETNPKEDLKRMAHNLGIRYQFSDFPKSGNKGFVTLVQLTTVPPNICYGEGLNTDQSQDKAALTALSLLYKAQLSTISKILKNDQNEDYYKKSEKFYMVDREKIINSVIPQETE